MEIIRSARAMQRRALDRPRGLRVGFVPTMGCLHEGHTSLIRLARRQCDCVVVSIFVNPTQFGPREDYKRYPRDLARDRQACLQAGADELFVPRVADIYPAGYSVHVEEQELALGLCGRSRPGHFKGVLTVVAKLFNLVRPDVAVFGRKDAQQLRLIRQLARDLNFPVKILAGPIVRERDGLAMSSRNRYLSPEERTRATSLYRALCAAKTLFAGGERNAGAVTAHVEAILRATPGLTLDYIELVDADRLCPVSAIERPALLAVAARLGSTRLIDNTLLKP